MLNTNRKPRSRLWAMKIGSFYSTIRWQWSVLAVLGILLVGCSFSESTPHVTDTPQPTQIVTPRTGSIRGMVWHDLCVNLEDVASPPPGCVASKVTDIYLANGILEPGEEGIEGVEISLGLGLCPSSGLAVATTESNGRYAFNGLAPGMYCVSANNLAYHQQSTLEAGVWTYPTGDDGEGEGSVTLVLGAEEIRDNVNFGWDYLVRPSPSTPEPTVEPWPTPTCTDEATFIKDVTIPDGTRLEAGESFSKTWRIRNSGSCTWSEGYSLIFISGYSLGGLTNVPLKGDVQSGDVVDLTVNLQSPVSNGSYKGFWMLRNSNGELFGVGDYANSPLWVMINVGPDPDPEITEWRGEYFDNRKLEGDPVLVRNDEEIDFNWSDGSPADEVPAENFSVRWTREFEFDEAIYRFFIRLDDGARLLVDDRLVIDEWKDGANRAVSVDLAMAKGEHDLKLEYYEHSGEARILLRWEKVKDPSYSEWRGEYWFSPDLDSEWSLVRNDQEINFDWGDGSPDMMIPRDDFSAYWRRWVEFEPGIYRFYARSDDGIRVYLDDSLFIDQWHDSSGTEVYTADLTLTGSNLLQVEYYEHKGDAKVELWWEMLSPLNDPPVAVDDAYTVNEDGTLQVTESGVLENDVDMDGDTLEAAIKDTTSNGNLMLNVDGSFIYQPNPDFNGVDTFTYKANDGSSDSNLATVTIIVNSVDDEPIAVDDSVTTEEDTPIDINILGNDMSLGDTPISVVVEELPTHGTAEVVESRIRYIPAADFNGQDNFIYKVTDADGDSSVAKVTVEVNSVNDQPVSVDDAFDMDEDGVLSVEAPGVLGNDSDQDGDQLTAMLETGAGDGSVTLNGDGSFTYTPNTAFTGVDSFSYKVSDGLVDSNVSVVTIAVNPQNIPPVAVDDTYSVDEDSVLEVAAPGVLGDDSDVDGDPLTALLENGPSNGSLSLDQDGSLTYTPDPDFNGTDSFTYQASDGEVTSSIATVTITVNPVNDEPEAVGDTAVVEGEDPVDISVLANDTGLGDQPVTITIESPPAGGIAEVIDNQIRYEPYDGYSGTDTFSYTVTDADGESSTTTVTVAVL